MKCTSLILYSLLALYLFIQASNAQSLPSSVVRHMASRNMRYHHYMWHQVRENWNQFSSSTQRAFRNIGWAPPNPSRDSRGNRISSNYAGEDFLYMHRQMIATARSVGGSSSALTGWTSIPAPGDRTYPVPPAFTRGSTRNYLSEYKTQSRYESMQRQESRLKDASRLRRMTLNELGLEIEGGIHNAMHLRWAGSSSVGYRGGGSASSGVPNIDKRWDSTSYNWLADSYSSQVHPVFWKLHGWIDDRVEDWRRANGLSSIRWRGTWVGGPMSNLGSVLRKEGEAMQPMNDDPEVVGEVLEEAFKIFQKSGVPEATFLDDGTRWRSRRVCKKRKVKL